MKQGILTVVAPLKHAVDLEALRRQLRRCEPPPLPLDSIPSLHFASLAIIAPEPGTTVPEDFRPHLVFEASFDGTREEFADELVAVAGASLDDVFRHCDGYPEPGIQLPLLVKNFLLRCDVGADALFIAYPRRTVGQIRQEHELRETLVELCRNDRATLGHRLPPPMQRSLVALLRRRVAGMPHLQGALTSPQRPFALTYGGRIAGDLLKALLALLLVGLVAALSGASEVDTGGQALIAGILMLLAVAARLVGVWRGGWRIGALVLVLAAAAAFIPRSPRAVSVALTAMQVLLWLSAAALAIVGFLVAVVALWLVIAQLHEWRDPEPPLPSWDPAREARFRRLENRRAQNHMVGLNRIKPGRFRRWTVRLVLWTIHATRYWDKSSMLAGISTIHFARWVVIDNGRQLLFLSHYDGDWDAYLGDFVEQASHGLTAIWSNCVGFPRSWLLLGGGARDQRAFKAYSRRSQHESLYVYSAYPGLTVQNIEDQTAIRVALGSSLDAAGTEALLMRL